MVAQSSFQLALMIFARVMIQELKMFFNRWIMITMVFLLSITFSIFIKMPVKTGFKLFGEIFNKMGIEMI